MDRIEHIEKYRKNINSANKELTKKELFKDLLQKLYSNHADISDLITKMSLGSETTVLNIPRKNKIHRGSADTLYNNVIIEFENDLKKSLTHAKEQLAGYLLGKFNSGDGYNFTLIASDFITWKVYIVDIECIANLGSLQEDELKLVEIKNSSFVLSETNGEDFYFWIDRFLFREEKEKATLERIDRAFGLQSSIFIESFRLMDSHFNDIKKYGEIQVSVEQWRKFLSIAYGSFEASDANFLIHSYLSVFAKLLAYSVISNEDFIEDEKMKAILDGEAFKNKNIENFVVDDFFHWIKSDRTFTVLKKVFRIIAQEISTFSFSQIDEDILKGVYQGLIDIDTRHSLGEYYTPDWLCEKVVSEYDFKINSKILDPNCGSGSFLRAAIQRLKFLHPNISATEINHAIFGIDIHPLSVQIAKTTVLIALGKTIQNAQKPIRLNIILANTLLAPDGTLELFGKSFKMSIDKELLVLNSQIFDDIKLFDDALDVCESLADSTLNKKKIDIIGFENNLRRVHKNGGLTPTVINDFYKIYESFKKVKETGRDSIWKFIVQNLYKPYFLANKFDFIVGNPPWFTYASIKNEEYQKTLDALAVKYKVMPAKVANYPHLEIAAIFLSYCSGYFLRENGKLAMVLPRSFFNADQHDNTRNGSSVGFKITSIWDLEKVYPLFNIPSCVFFAEHQLASTKKKLEFDGLYFSGKIPAHNCHWEIAEPKLTITPQKLYYAKQGKSSAFSTSPITSSKNRLNPYKNEFKQGATIVPRTFYFIDINQDVPENWDSNPDWKDRIFNIKTAEHVKADAKMPWKNIHFADRMESEFMFRTALAKNIMPFLLYKPELVLLPIIVETKNEEKNIKLCTSDYLLDNGFRYASKWFNNNENIWNIHRTEKNKKITLLNYLNWQNKLTDQNLNLPYLVIYTASAKDANATVVKRAELDLEFIVESKAYVFYTKKLEEAYYLSGYLNASKPNLMMKDFQSKGLFGPRDVHKKILDIYFPKFDKTDDNHIELAQWSEKAHEKAKVYIKSNPPTEQNLNSIALGKLRSEIKKHVKDELSEIDTIVSKLL
ncbi:MAG: restriction endonuclease [Bacteroidetes bacterium]|nr:MAG: restriction endonuclease [Bacteroidota bacterium]